MSPENAIPITTVRLGVEVEELVLGVLRSGTIAQGPMVKRLEDEFAAIAGVRHVIAVNNGTTALIAAIAACGIGPGDEVITSPFTFVATINAILAAGATVRFADIDAADFNVTADSIADRINPATRAVMPVHLYGQCADMPAISAVADTQGLIVIEDAAQAHGATVGGRGAGSWGVGCFSLYATKNLTSGEGGLITTDDDALADRLRVLRNQGMRERYQYEMAGNNYRLTDLQAAVCVAQLGAYDAQIEERSRNASTLSDGLRGVPGLITPAVAAGRRHVWHQYTVLIDEEAGVSREEFIDRLTRRGIGCGKYYPKLVHDYDCYRNDPRVVVDPTPTAERIVNQCVSLPVHPYLSERDVARVIAEVRSACGS